MMVEAFIVEEGDDGIPRWILKEVKTDRNWRMFMGFASTVGSAMYGEPSVYVQFFPRSDDVG